MLIYLWFVDPWSTSGSTQGESRSVTIREKHGIARISTDGLYYLILAILLSNSTVASIYKETIAKHNSLTIASLFSQ